MKSIPQKIFIFLVNITQEGYVFLIILDCFGYRSLKQILGELFLLTFFIFKFISSAVTPLQSGCLFFFLIINISFVWVLSPMQWCFTYFWINWSFKIKDPQRFKDFIKFLDILYHSQSWLPRQHSMQTDFILLL